MKVNYKKENSIYLGKMCQYREESMITREKLKCKYEQKIEEGAIPKETENETMFCTMQKNNINWRKPPILLSDKTYSFCKFIDTKIGKTAALSENEMWELQATFWNVDFTNCIFQNVKFKGCRFFGCNFNNCKTGELGVVFEECFFSTELVDHGENGEFITQKQISDFMNCHFVAVKFRNCSLENTVWENCNLVLTSFNDSDIQDSIFKKCDFYSTSFDDSNIAGVGFINIQNAELQFFGQYKRTEFNKSTYIELPSYKKSAKCGKRKERAENLCTMYYTLINCLKQKNTNINYLKEYKYQYQRFYMISKKKWYAQVWDRISWATCGFGEKIERFFLWIMSCIFIFAMVYMFSGIHLEDRNIDYTLMGGEQMNLSQIVMDFKECIQFSIVAFTTGNYGNVQSLTAISSVFYTIQIIFGALFIAILTSLLIKKIIRE